MDSQQTSPLHASTQRLGHWMTLILALFAFRVMSQFLVLYYPLDYYPDFDAWHSAALPYPTLFLCQILIFIVGAVFVWRINANSIVRKQKLGTVLFRLGWVYWSVMVFRLMLGLTLLRDVHWFAQTLPALFHLLLANMLILVGIYHRQDKGDV